MARGRFISKEITRDRQVNDLSSDTCRLAYTWTITHADREGRLTGEPTMLLSLIFPRRTDVTPAQMEDFIKEWAEAGFIIWYEGHDGDRVIELVNFEKHQQGLRKEREKESIYDDPEDCRIASGFSPDKIPFKLKNKLKIKNKNKLKINNESQDHASIVDKPVDKPVDNSYIIHKLSNKSLHDQILEGYNIKKNENIRSSIEFRKMIETFKVELVTLRDYLDAIDSMDATGKYTAKGPRSYTTWAINNARNRTKGKEL